MNKYIAEFIGTFTLVFFGTGAIALNETTDGIVTHIGISLTFGVTVMLVIYALGHISGAHINPAVSITVWRKKKFSSIRLTGYVVCQCAGALVASMVIKMLFPSSHLLESTIPAGSALQAFLIELLLSFTLMLVIIQIEKIAKGEIIIISIIIGLVVGLEAFFAGPVTGASMNPARSLGPALVSGHTEYLWVYLLAPVLGCWLGSKASYFITI